MKNLTRWESWAHGLFEAAIGGGASVVTAMMIDPVKFNCGDLKTLGKAFVVAGVVNACFYLKKSPLPGEGEETANGHEGTRMGEGAIAPGGATAGEGDGKK